MIFSYGDFSENKRQTKPNFSEIRRISHFPVRKYKMKRFVISLFLVPIVIIAQVDTLDCLSYLSIHIGDKWQYSVKMEKGCLKNKKLLTVLNSTGGTKNEEKNIAINGYHKAFSFGMGFPPHGVQRHRATCWQWPDIFDYL